jgi:glyoxylase-like metal-dependent hydrolase (beta-lactamase superfamily II)
VRLFVFIVSFVVQSAAVASGGGDGSLAGGDKQRAQTRGMVSIAYHRGMQTRWLAVLIATLIAATLVVQAQPRGPVREILPLTGDLYRARNGNWYTIFLVTRDGIILGDPINPAFATWLKDELRTRFKVPVRYVVYSHSHFDHAAGGAVFADTARFVAHENMLRNMDGRYPHMPGDMVDRNRNGAIDADEIDIPTKAAPGVCGMGPGFFASIDRDNNGVVPPAELQADIQRPDIVYSERMRITLGGRTVDLMHPGLNHSDDATVIHFPEERVVFATEFLADALVTANPRSLPSTCSAFDRHPLSEWIASYRAVEALDFDRVAPGHGSVFDKPVVTETREFFEYLVEQVSAGIRSGRPLADLKESITLERYKGWANYERLRRMTVEAAYVNLTSGTALRP